MLVLDSTLYHTPSSAGDKLNIVVVENATTASDLLAWHSKTGQATHSSKPLRIWDLQRLQAYDKLHQQKQAQANFAPGAVKENQTFTPVGVPGTRCCMFHQHVSGQQL